MATHPPVISRISGVLVAAAALGGMGNQLYATLNELATNNRQRVMAMYCQFDAAFSTVVGWANRVVPQFQNFEYGSPGDRWMVLRLFHRAVYALFPDRVRLGDPKAVLFSDAQILHAAFSLFDERALPDQHDLILQVSRDGESVRIEPYVASRAPRSS